MWGSLPYEHYLFINLLTGARGGLEHRNSMVIMADRFTMRTRPSYLAWLNLVSHEHFHSWNAKRLRPVELGPFDYENEVYTRNLWIAEGFTEYYGILAVRRAGLITDTEFLSGQEGEDSLSGLIEKLQNTPGRLQQAVSLASFDAWIKLYRPDENSVNSAISYYTKGAVIAWLLDARIRSVTDGDRSLDDIMRLAYQRFSGPRGFSTDEFIFTAKEVTSVDLSEWFKYATDSTGELDYAEALDWFGLRFKPPDSSQPENVPCKAWTGFSTKPENGRLIVIQVNRDTPAWEAGVSPGDEILGIDNYRVLPADWENRLKQYRPFETVSLLVSRSDRLTPVTLRFGQEPLRRWVLEIDPAADSLQKERFLRWLQWQPGSTE